MRVGLILGGWGAGPPDGLIERVQEAEQLGFDCLWVAEIWGSDAFTYATWLAAHTSTIKIGTSVVQLAARTPAATAMAASTLDHLSGGRFILGLGVSGPQVVEGWYGRPFNRPLARTREYVEIIRRALLRAEPLAFDGELYPLPYRGEGATGLGKSLKLMTHPLRADLPIYIAAEGPKNIAQTAEIADGWLPLFYSPYRQSLYEDQLRAAKPGFEISVPVHVIPGDDVAAALMAVRAMLGFYVGGMGSKDHNFHANLMANSGFPDEAEQIQELFLAGRRDEAIAAVPEEFADEVSLVGPPARIKQRLAAWHDSPITELMAMAPDHVSLKELAGLLL